MTGSRPEHFDRRGRLRLDHRKHPWISGVLAELIVLACAVVVTGAGSEQAQLEGQFTGPRARRVVVVAVEHLDTTQPGVGHLADNVFGHHPAPLVGERVRHDGYSPGAAHQFDRSYRMRCVVRDVVPAAGLQEGGKGLTAVSDHPGGDQCVSNVRTAERGTWHRLGLYLFPGQPGIGGKQFYDPACSVHSRITGFGQLLGECLVQRIGEVSEQVHADAARRTRDLDAPNERDAALRRGTGRFVPASGRVVVSEGDDIQPRRSCRLHDLRGGLGPVALVGVGVKVDTHGFDPIEARRHVLPASGALFVRMSRVASSTSAAPSRLVVDPSATATMPIRRRVAIPSIDIAVRSMYLGAALSVLAVPIQLASRGEVRVALAEQNATSFGRRLSPQDITDAAGFTVSFMATAAVVSAILWLILGWGLAQGGQRAGRARSIGTILAVLCVLKVYGTITQGGISSLGILIDLLQLAVALVVTVLVWSRRNSRHFESRTRGLL